MACSPEITGIRNPKVYLFDSIISVEPEQVVQIVSYCRQENVKLIVYNGYRLTRKFLINTLGFKGYLFRDGLSFGRLGQKLHIIQLER